MTGSILEIASIWPVRTAVNATDEAPTPMKETSALLIPFLSSRYSTKFCVPEPGAVTPIFMPLRSFGDL